MKNKILANSSAVGVVKDAIDAGREVIPFFGAGLSAGSGFPLINEIRDYLCKVRFLIETGVYRHLLGEADVNDHDAGSPQYNPARYIDCFGWPGLNQVNADLLSYINIKSPERNDRKWIDKPANNAEVRILGAAAKWGRHRWRLQTAVLHTILSDIEFHDTELYKHVSSAVHSFELKPRIDWFRYLLNLSGGRRGLIDALFSQLNARREPSLGHIMLAHLARDFGWRLHLTINFDTLLETAFRRERMLPTVFEVSRDTQPPDPALITGSQLALLKLHGGSYDLRIGEPLDYVLDGASRENVFASIPADALLLVIGFSGDERRMMQLIEELALRSGRPQDPPLKRHARVLWLHWEDEAKLPQRVKQLRREFRESGRGDEFCAERISDAGTFLLETYQHLTRTLPAGAQPYPSLPKHVISSKSSSGAVSSPDRLEKPIHIFARNSLTDRTRASDKVRQYPWMPRRTTTLDDNVTSRQMSRFAQSLRDYHLIWIDLEEHHTVSGIAGEVIQRMRTFDPHLPDLVLPVDDDPASMFFEPKRKRSLTPRFGKAVSYIKRALKRGRYTLAFDSLEGFGREQTGHHGLPWEIDPERFKEINDRYDHLIEFLHLLIKETHELDWYCCISTDEPSHRHIVPPRFVATDASTSHDKDPLKAVRNQIRQFLKSIDTGISHRHPEITQKTGNRSTDVDRTPATTNVSKFRAILDHLNAGGEQVRKFGAELQQSGFVAWEEGCLETAIETVLDNDRKALPDELAAFLILSAFRRPRSHAAVYGVLQEFWLGSVDVTNTTRAGAFDDWFSKTLATLQEVELLRSMDGGYYWVVHHAHEWTYKLLSEPTRWQCLKEPNLDVARNGHARRKRKIAGWLDGDWEPRVRPASGNPGDQLYRGEDRINRLILLVRMHSQIARFYYRDVFKRAKDIAGLQEYMYHRISSVKYVSTLSQVLVRFERLTQRADLESTSQRIRERIRLLCERDGVEFPSTGPDALPLSRIVRTCCNNFLRRLLDVLVRDEQSILSRGTADTWLSWINKLQDDIHRLDVGQATRTTDNAWPAAAQRLAHVRSELKWKLSELQCRLLREKGARQRCVVSLRELIFDQCNRCFQLVKEFAEVKEGKKHLTALDELASDWTAFQTKYQLALKPKELSWPETITETIDALIEICDKYFEETMCAQCSGNIRSEPG